AYGAPVAERALPPPALHRRLGEHDLLVDAPLAGGPAQDLLGGAGEVAIDARGDPLVGRRCIAAEEMRPDVLAGGVVSAPVTRPILAARAFSYPACAFRSAGQHRPRWQGAEVDRRGARRGTGRGGRRAGRGGVLVDERGDDEVGFGDCVGSPDPDAGGVLLTAVAGVGVGAVGRDTGASVIVGSTVVVMAAGGSGLLARAWPMLA